MRPHDAHGESRSGRASSSFAHGQGPGGGVVGAFPLRGARARCPSAFPDDAMSVCVVDGRLPFACPSFLGQGRLYRGTNNQPGSSGVCTAVQTLTAD